MFEKDFEKLNLNKKLIDAVLESNHEEVERLFALEEPPFVDTEHNSVPLILYSAQKKDWKMVEIFYNNNADLDAQVPYVQWHLVHECVKNAPERVTKAVVEYCNINAQTKDGKTALMVALKENNLSMADFLIDTARMDLALVDKDGNNAAHYAAKHGHYDTFIKLAQAKIPLNKENNEGKTPIDTLEDVSFKENLPKILGELSKIEKKKTVEIETVETDTSVQKVEQEIQKPKVSGLSSIKRK